MKKLPSIYTNIDDKKITNNKKVYCSFAKKTNRKKEKNEKIPNQSN